MTSNGDGPAGGALVTEPAAPDPVWLPAVGRRFGGSALVVGRAPLAGGYSSGAVERVDLEVGGRAVAVVLKRASAVEVAAMRALAVVRDLDAPQRDGVRLLAAGDGWLVLPHVDGDALADGAAVPDAVWDLLARVHAHWWRKRPRGVPVVDQPYWRALCDRTLVAVRGALARTGDAAFATAEEALLAWRDDPRIESALALLPRTLVHGDLHRGNVLTGPGGTVVIDWGGARVAPAGVDLAVLRAQGASVPDVYEERFAALAGAARPPALRAVEERWADVHVHVQYLGFAADHLGAERVTEMVANATRALDSLDLPPLT